MTRLLSVLAVVAICLMCVNEAKAQRGGRQPFAAAAVKLGPVRASVSVGGGGGQPQVAQFRQGQTFHNVHHNGNVPQNFTFQHSHNVQQLNALNTFTYNNVLLPQNVSFFRVHDPAALIVSPASYTYVAPNPVVINTPPPTVNYIVQQAADVTTTTTTGSVQYLTTPLAVTDGCPAPAAITGTGVYYQTLPQRVIVPGRYWH